MYQYALDGTFIREFDSTQEACAAIGKRLIFNANDATLVIGGYLWRRYKADKIEPVQYHPQEKPVHQYSITGEYIATFDSLAKAARAVRGRNRGTLIGAVCRGDRQYAYGYRWSFEKEERLHEAVPPKHFKKVVRITPDTGEEKVYSTIAEAAKDNNACAPNITEVCKGRMQTCKGYYWKYV